MDARTIGLLIVIIGLIAVGIGGLMAAGVLGWVGRLPGDIRYERDNVRIYFPITTMILLSVVVSAIVALIRWRS